MSSNLLQEFDPLSSAAGPGSDPAPSTDEGTVLWSEDKKSISVIFEIFGPVKSPYYSVHVKSPEHAHSLGLDPEKVVYVVPGSEELTKYVFTQKLLLERGSDASWRDDAEVPEDHQDFSDDEAEMKKNRSKRTGKHSNQATPTPHDPSHAHKKKQKAAPSYSRDPKMRAYFPGAGGGAPPSGFGPMGPPLAPGPHPPRYQGDFSHGMPYYTPRGFMGYLPPGMEGVAPQYFPPPHQGMHPYQHPPGAPPPGIRPQHHQPPPLQNLPPRPLMMGARPPPPNHQNYYPPQ